MKIEYSNFSEESRRVLYSARIMAEKRNGIPIDSVILILALCEKSESLCYEVFSQLNISVSSFIAEIEKQMISNDINSIPCTYTDEAVLVLIKASYNALSKHIPVVLPIHILQAIFEDNKIIQEVLLQYGINKTDLSNSIEQYSRAHPYSWQSVISLDSRMSGYGYDVCNDKNISEFQAGYLINALEAYCDSGYLREFTMKEKKLLSKLSEGNYHIGGLVSRIKKEMNSAALPTPQSNIVGKQLLSQTESQQHLSIEEKRKWLKARLLGK